MTVPQYAWRRPVIPFFYDKEQANIFMKKQAFLFQEIGNKKRQSLFACT
jgi:hypothetical protein